MVEHEDGVEGGVFVLGGCQYAEGTSKSLIIGEERLERRWALT